MKNYTQLMAVLLLFVAASCSSPVDDKVKDLEARVSKLEGKNPAVVNRTTPAAVTPVANTLDASTSAIEAEPTGPAPAFTFVNTEHDFGTIKEGDVVSHVFKFTNTGEAPLVIENATASCGCTVPTWTREPVPVGAEGQLEVKFNSANKKNQQNKPITITANTYPAQTKVYIKTFVEPAPGGAASGPLAN